ncbi:MAG: hypothetical protein IJD45_07805 [Clostridia bacterium]|nr:hypothetical protein [Clostridia bacterium]
MQYLVGLQVGDDALVSEIIKNKDSVSEVYFSWGDIPNGRNTLDTSGNLTLFEMQQLMVSHLDKLKVSGIDFNLLLNANCYGADSQSRSFFNKVGNTIDYITTNFGLSSVTTTSPLIAKFVKQNFSELEVRASVNMEIGTTEGMDYIADLFDSFYLKREYNRNLQKIKQARTWCDANGKKLYGLANSGCLNFCTTHIFHDNLVAHESEISARDNGYQFDGQCWEYLRKEEKLKKWLSLTNFIRPEDVHLYEGLFEGLKLATRVNKNPVKIVNSYCNASYNGAITDLLEPNHSGVFYPTVIDNKEIAADFAETVLKCLKNCNECSYCNDIQKNATVVLE